MMEVTSPIAHPVTGEDTPVRPEALDQAASAGPEFTPRGGGSATFRRKLLALRDVLHELHDLSRTIERQREEAGRTVRLDGRVGGEALVKAIDDVANRFRGVVTDLQNQGKAGKEMLGAIHEVGKTLVEADLGLERREGSPLVRPIADHATFDARAREAMSVRHRPQPIKSGSPSGDPPRFDHYG